MSKTTPSSALPKTQTTAEALTILKECVHIVTGTSDATARPGQQKLTRDIAHALRTKTHIAGIAPTGTGKSLAVLSAAADAAHNHHERTLVSTDSLALQGQYISKDLPVVAEALNTLTGHTLTYAVLKGVGNYVDPMKLIAAAQEITGENTTDLTKLKTHLTKGKTNKQFTPPQDTKISSLKKLILWGIDTYFDDDHPGDRESCPINHTATEWSIISASSEEAAKEEDTGYIPKSVAARERVAEAEIVITNHTLLGIQASKSLPIVIGNMKLGAFDNIIVDEGHTLPNAVRSQGQTELSRQKIVRLTRTCTRVIENDALTKTGWELGEKIHRNLRMFLGNNQERRVEAEHHPLPDDLIKSLFDFLDAANKIVDAAKSSKETQIQVKYRRAKSSLSAMQTYVKELSEHNEGVTRWVAPTHGTDEIVFAASPVNVAGLIVANLWTKETEEGVTPEHTRQVGGETRQRLGVAVVSATLPQGFEYEAGITGEMREYESPFANSYAASALYIPATETPDDLERLGTRNYRGELKFDTNKHIHWCTDHIIELCEANQGSALVLAAKTSSGKHYVEQLREQLPQYTVLSQWDGEQTTTLVNKWREDKHSILVGTKSFMTGIDVKGESNTLVIVDRPPRSAKNAVDDARVEVIATKVGGDKWLADRLVYVSDAALLLDQAAGRLIRSIDDTGLVAVVDPRLVKYPGAVFTYPEPTRNMYMGPLRKFGHKMSTRAEARAWLEARTRDLANSPA